MYILEKRRFSEVHVDIIFSCLVSYIFSFIAICSKERKPMVHADTLCVQKNAL